MHKNELNTFIVQLKNKNLDEIIPEKKSTLLHIAVKEKKEKFVEALCMAGADLTIPDQTGIPAIVIAIRANNWSLVKLLLNFFPKYLFGYRLYDKQTLFSFVLTQLIDLQLSSFKKDLDSINKAREVFTVLIENHGLSVGNNLYINLCQAVINNDTSTINRLSKNLNINYQYDSGITLLHIALVFGSSIQTLECLLKNSNIRFLTDSQQLNPADYAIIFGNTTAYKRLLIANPVDFFNIEHFSKTKHLSNIEFFERMITLVFSLEFDLANFLRQHQFIFDNPEFSQNLNNLVRILFHKEMPPDENDFDSYSYREFKISTDTRNSIISALFEYNNFNPNTKISRESYYYNYGIQEESLTILHLAAKKNDIELLKLLITHPNIKFDTTGTYIVSADGDRWGEWHVTTHLYIARNIHAVHMAAIHGASETLELLLEKNPKLLTRTFDYRLGLANRGEIIEMPEYLDSLTYEMSIEIERTGEPENTFWEFKQITLVHYFCIIDSWPNNTKELLDKHKDLMKKMLYSKDNYKLLPFDYAFCYRDSLSYSYSYSKLVSFIWDNLEFPSTLDPNSKQRLLKYFVILCKEEAVKKLLKLGAKVTEEIYDETESFEIDNPIKKLFDYCPGRETKTIYERYQNGNKPSIDMLERLFLDYADTSSDSSSDEEEIRRFEHEYLPIKGFPIEIPEVQLKQLKIQHQKNLEQYNKDKTQHSKIRYIIHRGLHFDPIHCSTEERRKKRKSYLDNPSQIEHTTSFALLKLIEEEQKKSGNRIHTQAEIEASQAYKTIEDFLKNLKKTNNKKPLRNDKRATEFYRLIQAYVHDYAEVINKEGIKSDFGFAHPWNPLISTSFLLERAFVYASGMLFPKEHRLNPHYRRSTGKPKHPILGIVYSYAIDLPYANAKAINVLDLNNKGEIGIKGHYQHECEVIFENFIPDVHLLNITFLRLPSFAKSLIDTPLRWKYTTPGYTRHQNSIFQLNIRIQSEQAFNGKRSVLNNIIRHVIEGEAEYFSAQLHLKMYQQGIFPAYPFKDGTLTISPVKPPKAGKWGDKTSPTFFSHKEMEELSEPKQTPQSPYTKNKFLQTDEIVDQFEEMQLEDRSTFSPAQSTSSTKKLTSFFENTSSSTAVVDEGSDVAQAVLPITIDDDSIDDDSMDVSPYDETIEETGNSQFMTNHTKH